MLEKTIEAKLRKRVQEAGGLCLKFECPGYTGVPDRIILLPGGTTMFAETKQPGKKERPRQRLVQSMLRDMGFRVFSTVDSAEAIDHIIDVCREEIDDAAL